MVKAQKGNSFRGILTFIVVTLLLSGGIRVGIIGIAFASNPAPDDNSVEAKGIEECVTDEATIELMSILQKRDAEMMKIEEEQTQRQQALDQAEAEIFANLARLEEAEKKLSNTIEQVNSASSGDIDQLTAVYQSMKPKDAAQLFEQMTPKFAAGFLSGMPPAAAAGILSGLSSEKAYAVSVVLAGRNATASKE